MILLASERERVRIGGESKLAKLRKTLPKDFKEIVASGDVEEIRSVLKKCEPNATYSAHDKRTALMNPDLPSEIIQWLVEEYGADVNYSDPYCRTPLTEAAVWNPAHIGLLVSLGADVNLQKNGDSPTALMVAARFFSVKGVSALIEYGADVHKTVRVDYTDLTHNALNEVLRVCSNARTPETAEIARILIDAGVEITEGMREKVEHIGETFEFYRDSFDPEYLPACDAGLAELYKLFGVTPVPHKQKYDGSKPISVKGKTWTQQYRELWDMLVPGSGKAPFVQGEAIRIIGRLSHEVLDNGGCNWDGGFIEMRDFLAEILSGSDPADESVIKAVRNISPNTGENAFEMMAKAVVEWILSNPEPVALGNVAYYR